MAAVDIEIWHVPTPIPHPVLTAVGRYDTYNHVVVVARADGAMGWGYSGMATASQLDDAVVFARDALADRPHRLETLLAIESLGYDTASRGATSAMALSAWDLAGHLLDVPVAALWGQGFEAVPLDCYASGFFLDASIDALVAEAERYRDAGFQLVKMRTGLSLEEDVARFRAVQSVFDAPRTIAVDAFHSWTAAAARAFIDAVDGDLLWVEDATPYDEMSALHPCRAMVASAESLETAADVVALVHSARLDAALIDVQRLGGPRQWLDAAQACAPAGARVGSHVYTGYSAHLLASVANPLPVEVFDWSDALFVNPPTPNRDGRFLATGPGFGLALDAEVLARYGRRVV